MKKTYINNKKVADVGTNINTLNERERAAVIKKNPEMEELIRKDSLSPSVKSALKKNKSKSAYDLDDEPEDIQLLRISEDPSLFMTISNPSMNIMLAAVSLEPKLLSTIENPPQEVQVKAINEDPKSISLIKTPTEEVQLAAIKKDPLSIQYIDNPTEKAQLSAVELDKSALYQIDDPTNDVQAYALTKAIQVAKAANSFGMDIPDIPTNIGENKKKKKKDSPFPNF